MAVMPPFAHRFVLVLLVAWALFAGWSAATQGLWMRWLLVVFLLGCVSFLRKTNESEPATMLPPAAMALSFGLDSLHEEDLVLASVCLVTFLALLAVVVKDQRADAEEP